MTDARSLENILNDNTRLATSLAAVVCVITQAIREARFDGETEILVYEGTTLLELLTDASRLLLTQGAWLDGIDDGVVRSRVVDVATYLTRIRLDALMGTYIKEGTL